jgi:hypothetical protein
MKTLTDIVNDKWDEFPSSGMRIDQYKLIDGVKNDWDKSAYYDYKEQGSWYIFSEAHPVQLSAGESLILVGSEGTDLSRNGMIYARACNIIGYGNVTDTSSMWLVRDMRSQGTDYHYDIRRINSINGINIFQNAQYIIDCNDALASMNLKLVFNESNCTLLSNSYNDTIVIDYYEGTDLQSKTVIMSDAFYSFKSNPNEYYNETKNFANQYDVAIPVTPTEKGYFYLDTSSLEKGLYMIQSKSGKFMIEIL